jgi:hypothetical protein
MSAAISELTGERHSTPWKIWDFWQVPAEGFKPLRSQANDESRVVGSGEMSERVRTFKEAARESAADVPKNGQISGCADIHVG